MQRAKPDEVHNSEVQLMFIEDIIDANRNKRQGVTRNDSLDVYRCMVEYLHKKLNKESTIALEIPQLGTFYRMIDKTCLLDYGLKGVKGLTQDKILLDRMFKKKFFKNVANSKIEV